MKIPTFSHMGGKARLRKWLVEKFPRKGNLYFEPFSGAGNVFYLVKNELEFDRYWLNDRYSYNFLRALKELDSDFKLPNKPIDEDKKKWLLENRTSTEAVLIENVVTFGGKGYSAGFTTDLTERYNPEPYLKRLLAAKELLKDTFLSCADALELDYSAFGRYDFVYMDPPYYGTKASYPNIDHEKLVGILNNLRCRWALSGYDNPLYAEKLKFVNKFQIERNSEIKSSAKGTYTAVTETLWTNYE